MEDLMTGLLRLKLRCMVFLLIGALLITAGQPALGANQPAMELPVSRAGIAAGPPVLLLDINSQPSSSLPKFLHAIREEVYFIASTPANGEELWVTDGTAKNTKMVKDICPGFCSPNISSVAQKGGILYFTAALPDTGSELWRSNGTEAGTYLVKDINPGIKGSNINRPVTWNNKLYFSAMDGTHGVELWESNGLASGTAMVADICPDDCSGAPGFITVFNDELFFQANSPAAGAELWHSDGTATGTALFMDMNSGPDGSSVLGNRAVSSDLLYFTAYTPSTGVELYRTDGTGTGTVLLMDVAGGSSSGSPSNLAVFNENLYFAAASTSGNYELYTSNGTPLGTKLFKEINPSASGQVSNIAVSGSRLYFSANDGVNGMELWSSDGTVTNTSLLEDITPGAESSALSTFYDASGTLFFEAGDGLHGSEPWKSGGTITNTALLGDNYAGATGGRFMYPTHFEDSDGHLNVLYASRDVDNGLELWIYHRVGIGPINETYNQVLKDIDPSTLNSTANTSRQSIAQLGTQVIFQANDGVLGDELWITDISGAPPTLVKDINPDGANGNPDEFTLFNGQLYFTASYQGQTELWVTDGTESGTTMAVNLNGDNPGNVQYLTVYNDALYFSALDTGAAGQELYRFDGTTATLVKDVGADGGSSDPANLMIWNGLLYFTARTADGNQIWRSDGTEAGTVLAGYIEPGASGDVDWLTPAGDYLVFVTSHSSYGYELFRLDGVSTQTELVKDIVAGTGDGSPNFLIPVGNLAFFEVNEDGVRGTYRTDGTPDGTYMVMAVDDNPAYLPFQGAAAAGSLYYFTAYTTAAGFEIFKSDGTPTGTVLVSDIVPGAGSSYAVRPFNVFGTIFFAANDGPHGMELWQTDGTDAGTQMVADIFPGIGSSSPFVLYGTSSLFFSARDGSSGYELWLYQPDIPGMEVMLPLITRP